jgi:CheY-like chemotaxis protein
MSESKRILVVDDEEDIRDVVQASLEEFAGWRAITAATGLEGLAIARTNTLDAILLDISMPDVDGLQICKELKADPQTQMIPVIVLTAKVLPRDRQLLESLDVAGIISKPFKPLVMWKQVAEILGWHD